MLQKIPIKINTPEWLELKQSYIGCSDIPVLTGSNRNYYSPLDIFYIKIGMYDRVFKMAERPMMGHIQEPVILDLWQYYEKELGWVDNYQNNNKVRHFEKNTGYILVNEDTPFLSVTPDATIPAGQPTLFGEVLKLASPLQAKNIDSLKWAKHDGWIPEHREQVLGEMAVFGADYGELVSLVGGNTLHVEPIERDEDSLNAILSICRYFWYEQVVPAKALAKRWKLASKQNEKNAIMKDIYALEPAADDSEAYRSFLSARFVNLDKQVKASSQMESLMHFWQYYDDIVKELDKKKRAIKNVLLRYHDHNGVSLILGDGCRSSMNKKHVVSGNDTDTNKLNQILKQINT